MFRLNRLASVLLVLAAPGWVLAQQRISNVPVTNMNMNQGQAEPTPNFLALESSVSFIDSALPRNTLRTRVDLDYRNNRPTRAEYLYSRQGLAKPETRVDSQEFETYFEFAATPWFSFFAAQPYRWINPDVNDNHSGAGNTDLGLKFAFWDTSSFVSTFQLRVTTPTAASRYVESRHWAIEPALLLNCQVMGFLTLEGEARYWMPLTNQPFAGDVARYGLGIVYGGRNESSIWVSPVAELVGWTVLGGHVEVVEPMAIEVQGASGQTILNGSLGVRLGLGGNMELYTGYSRALTGTTWYKDLFRVEFRLTY